MRIWAIIRKRMRIAQQCEANGVHNGLWDVDAVSKALTPLCEQMDVARPVVLDKHVKQLSNFGKTAFRQPDFVEAVSFDALEIELIDDDNKKVKYGNNDIKMQ